MTLFKNSNYRVAFDGQQETLQFYWEDGHEKMSYEDFQEACCNFLGYGFEYQAKNILIDVRNFKLNLPPEFPAWQQNDHYPRYHKLGIQKVAYVMPAEAVVHAKSIEKEAGKFELKNFAAPEAAVNWLN